MTPPVLDPWEDASAFPISVQDESELFSLWLFQKKKINALNPAFPKTILWWCLRRTDHKA